MCTKVEEERSIIRHGEWGFILQEFFELLGSVSQCDGSTWEGRGQWGGSLIAGPRVASATLELPDLD